MSVSRNLMMWMMMWIMVWIEAMNILVGGVPEGNPLQLKEVITSCFCVCGKINTLILTMLTGTQSEAAAYEFTMVLKFSCLIFLESLKELQRQVIAVSKSSDIVCVDGS
ncbi:uncharacterized protein [Rutidosis leptorrhynchoides]|uniref:uncharacterized protein n=1 Tax=Rutidosis leptorrhynchoides TaxID=125765 RepID=UPI003A993A2B